jgi:hypothetical protein
MKDIDRLRNGALDGRETVRLSGGGDCPEPENGANGDKPCPYVTGKTTHYCTLTPFTLTDEEREAVEVVVAYLDRRGVRNTAVQETLRGLLERTK